MRDTRDEILSRSCERCASQCAEFGHDYVPDFGLYGDYACRYCRAARALTAPLPNDKVRKAVR